MRRTVGGIVLAAGLSRRMGNRNKLLLEIDGTPMVRRVVETALAAGLDPVVVVVGYRGDEVRQTLAGLPVTCAENQRPEAGLSSSLRTGIDAIAGAGRNRTNAAAVEGAVVLLGDMPWVEARHISALLDEFDPTAGFSICVPVHEGRRGNPVLWDARFFSEMAALDGDVGARALLERHAAVVHEVPVDDAGVLRDVDTPDEHAAAAARS